MNVQELTQSLFDKRSWLAAVDPAMGKYLTASIAYRGKLGTRDSKSFSDLQSLSSLQLTLALRSRVGRQRLPGQALCVFRAMGESRPRPPANTRLTIIRTLDSRPCSDNVMLCSCCRRRRFRHPGGELDQYRRSVFGVYRVRPVRC